MSDVVYLGRFKHDLLLQTAKIFVVIEMTAVFSVVWLMFYADRIRTPYYFWGDVCIIALFMAAYIMLGKTYDAFMVSVAHVSETVYSQFLTILFTDFCMYILICLLSSRLAAPVPLLVCFVVQLLLALLWCFAANKLYYAIFPPKKSAIIYDNRKGFEKLINTYGLDRKFTVEAVVDTENCLRDINMLEDFDTVFLSGVHSKDRNVILKYCVENDIEVYVVPRVGDVIMSSAKRGHMFHLPIMKVARYSPSPVYLFLKRLFDIFVSSVSLILLSPVFLVTGLAIKLTDGGPVFYKQKRLTKNRKEFYIHKFRSMRVDAEKDGVARLSTGEKDDRITPVGRIIRKVRIDELPQLIDIMVGNLSIVGPRPERPEIAEQYEKEMPEFKLRLQVKAGLTGYAQVYGQYNTTPYDKLQMDLIYIANTSVLEDLKICFATVKILFMPESTEGVAEGQTTAMGSWKENESTDDQMNEV